MGMQSDVQASQILAASGPFLNVAGQPIKRCRIKAIYAVSAAAVGNVILFDGVGGVPVAPLNTPTAVNAGYVYIEFPGQGLLCANGPAAILAGVNSVTLFYG